VSAFSGFEPKLDVKFLMFSTAVCDQFHSSLPWVEKATKKKKSHLVEKTITKSCEPGPAVAAVKYDVEGKEKDEKCE
jgi:hypothetical protein